MRERAQQAEYGHVRVLIEDGDWNDNMAPEAGDRRWFDVEWAGYVWAGEWECIEVRQRLGMDPVYKFRSLHIQKVLPVEEAKAHG